MQTLSPETGSNETVTLVFLEIGGAASFWETHTVLFPGVTAACRTTVQEFVEACGGTFVKEIGATYFLSFPLAAQAVSCVRAILHRVYQEHWPAEFAAQGLCAAVETGTPVQSNGDYFGPVVNRCARLLEYAAPWQILLTEAVRQDMGGDFPDGLLVQDRGLRRLRATEETTHLYEVFIAGLPHHPARLTAADSPLPTPITGFIGRKAERETLTALLRNPATRLLTLHGIGGIGKSRLAVETAGAAQGDFARLFYTDCLEEGQAGTLLAPLAALLEIPAENATPTVAGLAAALQGGRCLLLLDNFEFRVGEKQVLEELLQTAPDLTLLVTSRIRLHLDAETVFSVEPLSTDEGLSLLTDRAQMALPDFVVTKDNLPALRDIVTLLDGLPLAIELAAPLLRGLAPAQLLARMWQKRLELARARRDPGSRHYALRQCFTEVYALLSPEAQRLFVLLAELDGEFPLEAALETAAGEGFASEQVLPSLQALCDNALVMEQTTEDGPRYRLLSLVRAFAQEKQR